MASSEVFTSGSLALEIRSCFSWELGFDPVSLPCPLTLDFRWLTSLVKTGVSTRAALQLEQGLSRLAPVGSFLSQRRQRTFDRFSSFALLIGPFPGTVVCVNKDMTVVQADLFLSLLK